MEGAHSALSVIIPTHRRPQLVARALDHLARQEDAPPFEVVVVVDGEDPTTAAALRRPQPVPVTVVEQPHSGQAAARNRGAKTAVGSDLVFLDDDMAPHPRFLGALAAALDGGADVALARVRLGDWAPATLLARELRDWDRQIEDALERGRLRFDDVLFAATAVRRDTFERAGGFDEAFTAGGAYGNEDLELAHRLLTAGATVAYAPDAVADSDAELDPVRALRRERQVGVNDVRLARKHPETATVLFGRRYDHSRIHRAVAPLLLAAPWAAVALAPLRWAVTRAVEAGRSGRVAYRVWFLVRAAEYWRGVADAGGRPVARRRRGG